jgi:hypothetical protein
VVTCGPVVSRAKDEQIVTAVNDEASFGDGAGDGVDGAKVATRAIGSRACIDTIVTPSSRNKVVALEAADAIVAAAPGNRVG